jgi:hypothetical protein
MSWQLFCQKCVCVGGMEYVCLKAHDILVFFTDVTPTAMVSCMYDYVRWKERICGLV